RRREVERDVVERQARRGTHGDDRVGALAGVEPAGGEAAVERSAREPEIFAASPTERIGVTFLVGGDAVALDDIVAADPLRGVARGRVEGAGRRAAQGTARSVACVDASSAAQVGPVALLFGSGHAVPTDAAARGVEAAAAGEAGERASVEALGRAALPRQ